MVKPGEMNNARNEAKYLKKGQVESLVQKPRPKAVRHGTGILVASARRAWPKGRIYRRTFWPNKATMLKKNEERKAEKERKAMEKAEKEKKNMQKEEEKSLCADNIMHPVRLVSYESNLEESSGDGTKGYLDQVSFADFYQSVPAKKKRLRKPGLSKPKFRVRYLNIRPHLANAFGSSGKPSRRVYYSSSQSDLNKTFNAKFTPTPTSATDDEQGPEEQKKPAEAIKAKLSFTPTNYMDFYPVRPHKERSKTPSNTSCNSEPKFRARIVSRERLCWSEETVGSTASEDQQNSSGSASKIEVHFPYKDAMLSKEKLTDWNRAGSKTKLFRKL